jgi:AcrR family transcriptional regulator
MPFMTINSHENPNARERILATATEIFLNNGFDSVSVREITEAAEVNVALVNYYFGSKRNLYLEVLKQKFALAAKEKLQSLQQLEQMTELQVRDVIAAYVELYLGSEEKVQASQNFLKLIARQFSEDDDAMQLLLQEIVVPIHQLLKQHMTRLVPQMDSNQISLCLGSVTGQIFHYLRFPRAFKVLLQLPEGVNLREVAIKHIIDFSLNGIQKESACA